MVATGPRIRSVASWSESLGDEAIDLAKHAGLTLLPWQCDAVRDILALDDRGRWAHFESGLNVARQNGKGSVLEAIELAGLFLQALRTQIHSAHEFATSTEHFMRIESLIQNTPDLHAQVASYRHSHGEEAIRLKNGSRLVFKTRTKSGTRGFSGDRVILDEAMVLTTASIGAMMPTLRASQTRRGPQLIYAGSAVDQIVHPHGLVWSRVRDRGIRGGDPSLCYIEYSADAEHPLDVTDEMEVDVEQWMKANPSLDVLITREHMEREHRSMDPRTFAVELLGVGDWPDPEGTGDYMIDPERWADLLDEDSAMDDPVVIAFDVSPDRRTSVVAGGIDQRGLLLAEVIDSRAGTNWAPDRIQQLYRSHDVVEIACDGYGPAASIANQVEAGIGVNVRRLSSTEMGQACGVIVDFVNEGGIAHLGQDDLTDAVKGARPRPLGDAWAWSRRSSAVNISPLVAATIVAWQAKEHNLADGEVMIY